MEGFKKTIQTAVNHIKRNGKLSTASILIMALTFFVSSLFVLALYGANIILNYFESQSQIIVFFNPDTVTSSYIDQVRTAVENEHVPLSITYVSKAQAYKKFIQFLSADSPTLSQSVDESKLPPSLEIKTTNIEDLQKVANVLYSYQNDGNMIDKILYYKNVEDFLKEFINVAKFSAIIFISFLGGISLLIIWITIGIALSSHADEIEIMQLVGATKSYIETPYILEGAIYGVIGALTSLISIGILYLAISKIYSSSFVVFLSYFKGIPLPTIGLWQIAIAAVIEIVIGGLVGSIGSFIAVRSKLR
jgi:cell division transport system permease protein